MVLRLIFIKYLFRGTPAVKSSPQKRDTYHVGNLAPQLLAEARILLAQVGPAKLSLRAVAEKVGVSSTAVYHHFSNRNDLLAQLAIQGFRELRAALLKRDKNRANRDKLREGTLAYFRFARKNPALYQLMFGPEFSPDNMTAELKLAGEEAFGELKAIIADVRKWPVESPEVHRAALAAWSFIHGLTSLVLHGVIQVSSNAADERIVDRVLLGMEDVFSSYEAN